MISQTSSCLRVLEAWRPRHKRKCRGPIRQVSRGGIRGRSVSLLPHILGADPMESVDPTEALGHDHNDRDTRRLRQTHESPVNLSHTTP